MRTRTKDAILAERLDQGGIKGEIRVFLSKAGTYMAEYKLGNHKLPVPTTGRDPIEALENAKKWFTTPTGSRSHATKSSGSQGSTYRLRSHATKSTGSSAPASKLLKQADELLSSGRYRLALARVEAAYQAALDAEDKQGEKDALRMIEGINDTLENG